MSNQASTNTGIPNVHRFKSLRELIQKLLHPFQTWSRKFSLYPQFLGIKCCAIEMAAAMTSRYDVERLGVLARASPRHCDMLWINGPITVKFAPRLRLLYDQMPAPKYVFATGECAIAGGPFWQADSIIEGTDLVIPVDVYVPGCPPRPEAMIDGILLLQEKIKREKLWKNELERGYPEEFYLRDPPIKDLRFTREKLGLVAEGKTLRVRRIEEVNL